MCGLVAVLPTYADGLSEDAVRERLSAGTAAARAEAERLSDASDAAVAHAAVTAIGTALAEAAAALTGPLGCHLLVRDPSCARATREQVEATEGRLRALSSALDRDAIVWNADEVERVQTGLRRAFDLVWTLQMDRIAAAERVRAMAAADPAAFSPSRSVAYFALEMALDSLDRLEVRGRDSAGIHLWVRLDADDLAGVVNRVLERRDPLFRSGAAELVPGGVSLVYKTAALVGRLGDNAAALRASMTQDQLLHDLLALPSARITVLGHTRWASVGRVNVPNTHPLNSFGRAAAGAGGYAVGALNGDIDNHMDLRAGAGLQPESEITTDAKLIPAMVADRLDAARLETAEALLDCLNSYVGSMAIGVQSDQAPDRVFLGVKGGGQGLYVGLSPVGYLVASEVFGLVAWAERYLRIEPDEAASGAPVVLEIDARGAGTVHGLRRIDAAGLAHDVPESALREPEVATRDIARHGFERYLEKELAEAPTSFKRTLRGRVHERGGRMSVELPDSTLPEQLRGRLRAGQVDELLVIGQGTAAVAAAGVAQVAESLFGPAIRVRALPASELSAWHLHRDFTRTCVVAISQSGTTTDTNRTVDLVRERGATVIGIVNRRESDLVGKSDGVLYTSDGRDIEMAVASTKAFYAQAAAGTLLSLALAKEAAVLDPGEEDAILRTLTEIPDKLEELEKTKSGIAEIAGQVACRYPYWAVLGSGPNRVAAAEVRIKASELCYCGVSCDAVEDKKHIDLSAESLVLVCAAGTPVTQQHDVMKEVEIFAAHRNKPVVIADAGTAHLWATDLVIEVPPVHPRLAWIMSTAAGHLFAYYAAQAIDAAATDLRLAAVSLEPESHDGLPTGAAHLRRFVEAAGRGELRGVLKSDTTVRLAHAAWFLAGMIPAEAFTADADADPLGVVRDTLELAIDELTRSIDTVKHQAKTVTVGTSRSGAALFDNALAAEVLRMGADRDTLSYPALVALRGYAGVVREISGAVRYTVSGDGTRLEVVRKSGVAEALCSRADGGGPLLGTKKLAADTRGVRLERGLTDNRLVLIVPEVSGSRVSGLTLLHVELAARASSTDLMAALEGAGSRLAELQAAITERHGAFDAEALAVLEPETVLLGSVVEIVGAVG